MLFASTHSPFTRTHSNHKLQPNSRNTASKHITAASAAQRHLTKSNICLYQLASALAVCPGGGMPAYGVSCPPPHCSHPAARQRRCHGGTMKRSAELDSVQIIILKGLMALILESVFAARLSLQTGFAVRLLWQSSRVCGLCVFRLSGHHGCAMLSERRDVRNKLLRWRCNMWWVQNM